MKGLSLAKNELTPSAKNRKEVTASLEKILNSPVIRYQQQQQQQQQRWTEDEESGFQIN